MFGKNGRELDIALPKLVCFLEDIISKFKGSGLDEVQTKDFLVLVEHVLRFVRLRYALIVDIGIHICEPQK